MPQPPGLCGRSANGSRVLQPFVRLALRLFSHGLARVDLAYDPRWSGSDVLVEDATGLESHDATIRALQADLWLLLADRDRPPAETCIVAEQLPVAGTAVVGR